MKLEDVFFLRSNVSARFLIGPNWALCGIW